MIAALVLACVALPVLPPARAQAATLGATQSYGYTGEPQPYVVPDGVTAVTFTVVGGAGQVRHHAGHPGAGAMTLATFPVTPGDELTIWVGGAGVGGGGWGFGCGGDYGDGGTGVPPGWQGGGGGGASAVTSGTTSLAPGDCDPSHRPDQDAVLTVAGGGGGGGGSGSYWTCIPQGGCVDILGDSTEGGDGGDPAGAGQPNQNPDSAGCGGCEPDPNGAGGEDHAAGEPSTGGGGGGGGGYRGGGGGHANGWPATSANGAGGGGGSSYISADARVAVHEPGRATGPGSVQITTGAFTPFLCTGQYEDGSVPSSAGTAVITAQGGGGSAAERNGPPGAGAIVRASYPVEEGWSYHVGVACAGHYDDAGFGFSHGGQGGNGDAAGTLDGSGGGGSTGVVLTGPDGAHAVVAGAGGGGGGWSPGGDGPGRGGDGGASPTKGGNGAGGTPEASGGCAGCIPSGSITTDGGQGHHSSVADGGGGGGGGGAGHFAGNGGTGGHFSQGNGAGGGAGSSWYTDGATHASITTAPSVGDGYVEIAWLARQPAAASVVQGSKQSAPVGTTFAQPLVAEILDANGDPMPGVAVEFDLATDGTYGQFTNGSTIATEVTGVDGTATSPAVVAADEAGTWSAVLSVGGTDVATSFVLTNEPDPSSVALSFDPTAVTRTQVNTIIATVAGSSGGPTPTGAVYFDVQGDQHSVELSNGVAELPIPADSLDLGTTVVQVNYGGDDRYGPSSTSATLDVVETPTSIALSAEPNPSGSGEGVVFSAQLEVPVGNATCVGCSIAFRADGSALGTGTVDASGTATLGPVDSLDLGAHTIEASFAGSSPWSPSQSSITQHVTSGGATVLVDAPGAPTQWGAALELTAQVTVPPGDPVATGQVAFEVGTTSACVATLDSTGVGTCTVAAPDTTAWIPGNYTITATYEGDTTYSPSTSTRSHTITPAATTATLIPSSPLVTSGDPVTFDVHIARTDPGAGTAASGHVTLFDDGLAIEGLEDLPIVGGALTTPSTTIEADGIHTIRVEFTPDASSPYEPATTTTPLTVHPAISQSTVATTGAAADPDGPSERAREGDSLPGQAIRISTTVTGGPSPQGLVQFLLDGFARGPMVPLVAGHATSPPIDGLATGPHRVEVRFLPAPGSTASVAAGQHLVSQPTHVIVASEVFAGGEGGGGLFAAQVGPEAPGGTLTFAVDGHPIEGCTWLPVDDSETVCPTASAPPGGRTLTVSYSGTRGYEPSQTTVAIPSGTRVVAEPAPTPATPRFTG